MVFILGLLELGFLSIHLFLHELQELLLRDVFEVTLVFAHAGIHEPREDLFKRLLLALLVRHVVAVGRLLVQSRDGVCRLFEAGLQPVKVYIRPFEARKSLKLL